MITYKGFGAERLEEVKRLYKDAGWTAYLRDDEKLERAFARSLYVLGAFCENKLVGFARCVGDGEHIVLLQDLLIESVYRRNGIGKELLRLTSDKFASARMFCVITDSADKNAVGFYRSCGLKLLENGGMTAFFRN